MHDSLHKEASPKIYLHIGTHKTGSSAIQLFLDINRKALSDANILYPQLIGSASHALAYYFGLGNRKLIEELNHNCSKDQQEKLLQEKILRFYGTHKDIVISSEEFSAIPAENINKLVEIKRFLSGRPIFIICYLRRQDHLIESLYCQSARNAGFTETIQDFERRVNLNYYNHLNSYAKIFGRENIIARTYENFPIKNNSLLHDFLNLLGLYNFSSFKFPEKAINKRFSPELLEILKLCPNLHREDIIKVFNKVSLDTTHNYPMLMPSERIEMLKKYELSNQMVADEFLHKADKKLFTEPWPETNEPWEPYRGFSLETIIPILMKTLIGKQNKIAELNERIRHFTNLNN